jgi:hypothetical protein
MRPSEDFKNAAKANNITKIDSHDCSMCGYMVGYIISPDYEHVSFDHGCDCTGRYVISERSWDDLAHRYNIQTDDNVIKRMNEFWGF